MRNRSLRSARPLDHLVDRVGDVPGRHVVDLEVRRVEHPRGRVAQAAVVPDSYPISVVSSAEKIIGCVASTRPEPTAAPSWYRMTSPPFASPPPSYANSTRTWRLAA